MAARPSPAPSCSLCIPMGLHKGRTELFSLLQDEEEKAALPVPGLSSRDPQASSRDFPDEDSWGSPRSGAKQRGLSPPPSHPSPSLPVTGGDASWADSEVDSSCAGQPIHLWQFLKELLLKPHNYGRFIRWLNKEKGEWVGGCSCGPGVGVGGGRRGGNPPRVPLPSQASSRSRTRRKWPVCGAFGRTARP